VFVANLDASDYIFCEATWTQQVEDFTASHERAFAPCGGVTIAALPTNCCGRHNNVRGCD
jgi:transposase